jgi:large subunit ribosomal protein L31
MKANLHPKFNEEVTVTCNCGNTFTTGSTRDKISVEVCYKCHPFYTGEHKFLDTKGRVEIFQKKQKQAEEYRASNVSKKNKKQEGREREGKSLRELLGQ